MLIRHNTLILIIQRAFKCYDFYKESVLKGFSGALTLMFFGLGLKFIPYYWI